MGAYLYKIGSILHRRQPEFLSENPKSLKREEVLFNQFINLLTEHHRKEKTRRLLRGAIIPESQTFLHRSKESKRKKPPENGLTNM